MLACYVAMGLLCADVKTHPTFVRAWEGRFIPPLVLARMDAAGNQSQRVDIMTAWVDEEVRKGDAMRRETDRRLAEYERQRKVGRAIAAVGGGLLHARRTLGYLDDNGNVRPPAADDPLRR